ncbi:MAG: tRNA (adenosine(37)-N6)-threonylcarbamoyltransferase complex dimerization subunit type 1 TsaB [Thermodesulfobacteriota bacterium]
MTSSDWCNNSAPCLVLNAAEGCVQVLLGREEGILQFRQIQARSSSMRLLPPAAQGCLQETGLKARDLGRIVCVRGPGTFTGVRVGLALGLGLAQGAGVPLVGLDYLPLLAQGVLPLLQGRIWVLVYARRDLVYMQGFAAPGGEELTEAMCVQRSQAAARINQEQGPAYVLGSALRQDQEFWQESLSQARILDTLWDNPGPEILLRQALQSKAPAEPLYLRPSDAEANLARIAEQRGLSLEQARQLLQGGDCRES